MTGTRIEQSVPWDRYPVPNTPIPKPNIEALAGCGKKESVMLSAAKHLLYFIENK